MKELICPNCHKAFTVDEADYASIVSQVKNAEFETELKRRVAELRTATRWRSNLPPPRLSSSSRAS